MNKGWDNTGVAFDRTTWEKVLRVLKPGGHILAFNHSRTFHRMAVAIEDAGFEIRDTIMWLYGSGFPKSHDISKAIDKAAGVEPIGRKDPTGGIMGGEGWNNINNWYEMPPTITEKAKQWEGWGTALKPAYEPILLARKPIPTTVADNVLTHGVGGLNIDECRLGTETIIDGRFPANIIHDGSEEVVESFPETASGIAVRHNSGGKTFGGDNDKPPMQDLGYDDSGSASRFFYTAKASKKDRDEGLRAFDENEVRGGGGRANAGYNETEEEQRLKEAARKYGAVKVAKRNIHPTVKPTDLMQYLIRLIAPKGATVLDIFMGSGSTGKAAMIENVERDANYHFIGIDRTEEYMPIAEARIEFGLHYLAEKPKADGLVHTDQIDLFSLL
jgi:site-specific DNA-methyltransferase (adenine-specific)